jgi:hypothetical protein
MCICSWMQRADCVADTVGGKRIDQKRFSTSLC